MSDADPQGWVGGLVAAVIAVGGGVAAWLKTRSTERVETVKDRAEEGLVERLQTRADGAEKRADNLFDELQELGKQHTEDARAIERLKSDLGHVTTENTSLRRNLRRMAERLPPDLRQAWEQALETDFAPLPSADAP